MPFPIAAAIIGGSLISGIFGKKAGDQQADASNAAVAEQRRQFDLSRQDFAPYLGIGQNALADISKEFGYPVQDYTSPTPTATGVVNQGGSVIPYGGQTRGSVIANFLSRIPTSDPVSSTPSSPVTPSYQGTGFSASPDYEFRRGEGTRGINNSFAARGGALSGNALRALTEFNSGLASSEYGNWFNRRAGLAGVGQTAVGGVGNLGAQSSANIGNALISGGNARASGLSSVNNAIQGGIQNILLAKYLGG